MGGVGKTTLLLGLNNELLCSSESVAFDYIIWTVASKDYNVVKLQRDISERLGLPKTNNKVHQATKEEVERILLLHSLNVVNTFRLPPNCNNPETFILWECISFNIIFPRFFENTTALIYLDLPHTAIYNLPSSIRHLVNLRFLNLSNTAIRALPLELRYLQQLRFLLLRNLENGIVIPHGVLENLVKLSVVDMTDTWFENWKYLFIQPAFLKGVGIVPETVYALHQLDGFPNAQIWRLGLRKLLGFKGPMWLLSSGQLGSQNIRSSIKTLKIEDCETLEVVSMESDDEGSSRNSQKWNLSRLEHIELRGLPALTEIIWRGVVPAEMLPSLTVLMIYGCDKLSDISWVKRLPSLEVLIVCCCDDLEQAVHDDHEGISVAGDDAFPSLRNLRLTYLRSLRKFANGLLTFPSLEILEVGSCPALPFEREGGRENLREIWCSIEWWEKLEMEDDVRTALFPRFRIRH